MQRVMRNEGYKHCKYFHVHEINDKYLRFVGLPTYLWLRSNLGRPAIIATSIHSSISYYLI